MKLKTFELIRSRKDIKSNKYLRRLVSTAFLLFIAFIFLLITELNIQKDWICKGYCYLTRQQRVAAESKEIYFGEDFESLYTKFESSFKVYLYKVDLAPSLVEIYKAIELLEKANSTFPDHWRVIKKKTKLPSLNSEKQYALEFWIYEWMKNSQFHTYEPKTAAAFFVNTPCTALKNTQRKRVPSQRVTQLYIKRLVENIMINMPKFATRMNFLDHFYSQQHER